MENMIKIYFRLSIAFAAGLVILAIGSGPTDFGPRVIPFALPFAICSAAFAIVVAILSRKE